MNCDDHGSHFALAGSLQEELCGCGNGTVPTRAHTYNCRCTNSMVVTCFICFQDTLTETGYSTEQAEEILARVISIIDSTGHFMQQATVVLEDVSV